jgi:hypothetical protein
MKHCESCGMPLGDETTSKFDGRYCVYCQDQQSGDLRSMEQVREGSVNAAMRLHGMSREEAERMAEEMLPKLPRWQT